MIRKKVLVLGAEGMLGHAVYQYLKNTTQIICFGTSKRKSNDLLYFEVNNIPKVWMNLLNNTGNIDYVINCIALLKNYPDNKRIQKSDYLKINTLFPKFLEKRSLIDKFKLLHFSTDSIFASNSGRVNENDQKSPEDIYDLTKLNGELSGINSLTIRTSIIGFDPFHKRGIIERVKKQNHTIVGYINQKWSGSTNYQIAELVKWLTTKNGFAKIKQYTSIIHYAPLGPTTKYHLIKKIIILLNKDTKLIKAKSGNSVLRYLSSRFIYMLPKYLNNNNIEHALKDIMKFESY